LIRIAHHFGKQSGIIFAVLCSVSLLKGTKIDIMDWVKNEIGTELYAI